MKTKRSHIIIFGSIFLLILIFIFSSYARGVILNPEDIIIHTELVYYDGKFSESAKTADTQTALYVLNESDETIYATVYEYDKGIDSAKDNREIKTAVQIAARTNQFIKPEGPGVVYIMNTNNTSSSTVKFSRWAKLKRYALPYNFNF